MYISRENIAIIIQSGVFVLPDLILKGGVNSIMLIES